MMDGVIITEGIYPNCSIDNSFFAGFTSALSQNPESMPKQWFF